VRAKEEEEKKKGEMNKALKTEMKSRIELGKLQKLNTNQFQANKTRMEKTVFFTNQNK
jgi:hypothetical protein